MHQAPTCLLNPAALRLLQACITTGTTNTDALAEYLCVSPHTVRSTFHRIHVALGVSGRYAAIKTALDNGWISS